MKLLSKYNIGKFIASNLISGSLCPSAHRKDLGALNINLNYFLRTSPRVRYCVRRSALFVIPCLALFTTSVCADPIDELTNRFANSEIVFQRSSSNAPFLPLAYVEVKEYSDSHIALSDDRKITVDQRTFSQSAIVPFLASPRDIIFLGEWINNSKIESDAIGLESFDVTQVALPIGWLRQTSDDNQVGGFLAPLGYKASLNESRWNWEALGGAFGRYVQDKHTWWAYGVYFNVGGIEDTYLPYLGAFWQIDDRWSLSAIMPWPAILYAPSPKTLFRFGASPTASAWRLSQDNTEVSQEISGWDFGLSGERRIYKNLWFKLEGGVGGLRALRLEDGNLRAPDLKVDASSYIKLGVNFRPSMP